jgi:hypothetical protein
VRFLTRGVSDFDPSAVLLSMTLDDARDLADRVASIWSAEAFDGVDQQGLCVLTRTLAEELPLLSSGRVSTLAAGVADSARALAASRWRQLGRERAEMGRAGETPTVDRSAVRGALLIHLHGPPDGPVSTALRQHHEQGWQLHAHLRRRRRPAPTREQLERFARALRAHQEELSKHLASLDGDH